MEFLIGLVVLSLCGIGAVLWLLKNDKEAKEEEAPTLLSKPKVQKFKIEEPEKPKLKPIIDDQPPQKPSLPKKTGPFAGKAKDKPKKEKSATNPLEGILKKLKLGKKDAKEDDVPEVTPMPNLKEYINGEKNKKEAEKLNKDPLMGTAAMKTAPVEDPPEEKTLSIEEEKEIEKELELNNELKELKEKYDKLESLFNEKSTEFEKTKESLDHELENRKEFNKVKDLLEKELKDSKDKTSSVQAELTNTLAESDRNKQRSDQLEDKNTKLEKDILEKEDKIDDLVKRMQTFSSPSAPSAPPAAQEEKVDEGSTQGSAGPDQTETIQPKEEITPEPEASPAIETPAPAQQDNLQEAQVEKTEEAPEEKTETTPPPNKPPEQAGGFKLNLTIDDDLPAEEADDQPQEDQFLKLQPDVIDNEPKEDETKTPTEQSEQPPEKTPPEEQTPDQPENNNDTRKE